MSSSVSPLVRRFAAIGLLLAFFGAFSAYVVAPAALRVTTLDDEITAKRELLGRLLAFSKDNTADSESIRRQAEAAVELGLPGETEPIRLANMQATVRRIAEEAGMRVLSSRTLPPAQRETISLASLQMSLQSPIGPLQQMLHRIETNRPLLLIDGLDITPIPDGTGGSSDRILQVELRVLAHLGASRKAGEP